MVSVQTVFNRSSQLDLYTRTRISVPQTGDRQQMGHVPFSPGNSVCLLQYRMEA